MKRDGGVNEMRKRPDFRNKKNQLSIEMKLKNWANEVRRSRG